ncbi:MAG TPA: hypothetical protein VMY42_18495 [Thermoguttaceae bacterium]|nr:hypothetical protein [Thermoguttaceae bacterium]
MAYPGKTTQLRPQMDEAKLRELAEKMKSSGRESLRIEKAKLGVKDLSFLEHFGHLKSLSISGVEKGFAAVRHLKDLEELGLSYLKQFKCESLRDLPHLKELYLGYMSVASCEGIADLVEVERLMFRSVSGVTDVDFVTQMPRLESLHLEECKGLTCMPDLSGMTHLTHVWLSHLSNLESIEGVFKAPALKKLVVTMTPKLEPEDLQPALSHPTLECIGPSLERFVDSPKNIRVAEILKSRFADVFAKDRGVSVWIEPRRTH